MLRFLFRLTIAAIILAALAVGWFRMSAAGREDQSAEVLLSDSGRLIETIHGQIHLIEKGPADGAPVLLIHGAFGWAGLWAETMEHLADHGFRAIAIDLPPMGLSDRSTRTDFTRQAQALRILAFLEVEDVKPVIVAHSFGAGAAFEAMMIDPERFQGGIVVAGALSLGQDGTGMSLPVPLRSQRIREAAIASTVTNPYVFKWLYQRFVHRKDRITESTIDTLTYPFTRVGTTETFASWLPTLILPPRGAASSELSNYAALEMPVALIWGREDLITPPDDARTLGTALNNAPIFWLENTGHIPQLEVPEEFHETLINALAVVDAVR